MSNINALLIDLQGRFNQGLECDVYLACLDAPLRVGVAKWHDQPAGLLSFAKDAASDAFIVREEEFRGYRLIVSPTPAPVPVPSQRGQSGATQMQRAYVELGLPARAFTVQSSADFMITIWAMNLDKTTGYVSVRTPPSNYRTPNATGTEDAIALELAGNGRRELGRIGGAANEVITLVGEGNVRLMAMITIETAAGASVAFSGGF